MNTEPMESIIYGSRYSAGRLSLADRWIRAKEDPDRVVRDRFEAFVQVGSVVTVTGVAVEDRSTDQERTPIAAHEGVLAGGIEALCEHAPAPGALGSLVVPVSVVRVPHAGSTSAMTVTETARSGAPVAWWPR